MRVYLCLYLYRRPDRERGSSADVCTRDWIPCPGAKYNSVLFSHIVFVYLCIFSIFSHSLQLCYPFQCFFFYIYVYVCYWQSVTVTLLLLFLVRVYSYHYFSFSFPGGDRFFNVLYFCLPSHHVFLGYLCLLLTSMTGLYPNTASHHYIILHPSRRQADR